MARGTGSFPTVPEVADRVTQQVVAGWWARTSLRARVTALAAVAVAVGLAAASALLALSLRSGLIHGLDDSAQSRAADAVSALARGDTRLAVSAVDVTDDDSSQVQVLGSGGEVVASSPALAGLAPLDRPMTDPRLAYELSIDDRDYRAYSARATGALTVVVVTPMTDVEEAMAQLAERILLGAPVLLALICTAVWVLVGYTLQTVDRLRTQVADLSAAGLDRRVDVPVAHDEVRDLALTMNDLLDRLERSAHTQRRFVADAAHELRSPLAALRARLEVSERADDPARWRLAGPVLLEDTERLSSLVDDLLALARLDESPRLRNAQPVDLDEIVFAEISGLRATTAVTLDVSQVSAGLVHGDPDLLTRIVRNLLSNAIRHASSIVRTSVSSIGGQIELTVADDGPGIPQAERERVFERFHRLDEARARDGGGSGLGLAIVRDAAHAHGGSVSISDARPGTAVKVLLPRERDSQQP